MADGNRQPKWDIYEAVILLEGFLVLQQKKEPRSWIIRRISADLRNMAVNRGETIDTVFRNENGISYQLQSMESAFQGSQIYVPATKLFSDTVNLYRENREEYNTLLKKAKEMIAPKENQKQSFLSWAATSLPATRQKWLEANLHTVESFGKTYRLIFDSIYDVTDLETLTSLLQALRKNKIFRIKHRKLYKNILDDFSSYIQYCIELEDKADDKTGEGPKQEETPPIGKEESELVQVQDAHGVRTVDFQQIPSMAYTKPVSVTYKARSLPSRTWKDAYVALLGDLFHDYPEILTGIRSLPGSTRLDFCTEQEASQLVSPRAITEHLFAETNLSATDIIKRIKGLLDLCGVDSDAVLVQYQERQATKEPDELPAHSSPLSSAKQSPENAFFVYLRDTAKLAEKTCFAYVSSVRSAERFAEIHGYQSHVLFSENHEETVATAAALFDDPAFIEYNNAQHKRFSAAINKLLESIGAREPDKKDPAPGIESKDSGYSSINEGLTKILREHYQYGFKYSSILELMRFRQFAADSQITIPDDDDQLRSCILASGTVIDNKVYCKNNDTEEGLHSIVEDAFSSGAEVIYYECLLEARAEWMASHKVTSEDVLKEYLRKHLPSYGFSKKFMVRGQKRTEKEAVTAEIKRVWGSGQTESVSNLSQRLPFIPLDNIWRVISGNDDFVFASEGIYLMIDRFHITAEEKETIYGYVNSACAENGFASLSDVPLGDIIEENYELSITTIWNAVYKAVLMKHFWLNGKILTRDTPELDAVSLLKRYIAGRDECSFDEVAEKAFMLTGASNRQYAFQALYDEMVRVDKNRFVATRFVTFDVDAIDHILSGFVTDHFRAIRDITTFALFPFCGQPWNHYLLESYCYKYSKKYCLRFLNFNDKNAGIIAEADYSLPYNELLSVALARSNTELDLISAGQYLCSAGYSAKSKFANLDSIVQKAVELRKER